MGVDISLSYLVLLLKVAFYQKVMADFQIAQKSAENYPELLHPVQSNDKILILNYTLQVKNYHSFKI